MVQNPNLLKALPPVEFDFDKWDEDTARRRKELDDALYADYRAYKAGTYQSPIRQASGFYPKGAGSTKTVPQGIYVNGQFGEADESTLDQKEVDEAVRYNEASVVIDNICEGAAEAFKDVFKTAHSVGSFVRKYLVPKTNRNVSVQDAPFEDEDMGLGIVHINNDSSDVKNGVQSQCIIIDVEDGDDGVISAK